MLVFSFGPGTNPAQEAKAEKKRNKRTKDKNRKIKRAIPYRDASGKE